MTTWLRKPRGCSRLRIFQNVQNATDGISATDARRNYFVRHWKGDLPLWKSYWVNGISTSIVALIASRVLGLQIESDMGPLATLARIVAFLVLTITLTAWQFIGVWRSASRQKERDRRLAWGILAKAAVVLGLVITALDLAVFLPAATENVKMAFGDKEFAKHSFRLLGDGTELEFSGSIGAGLTKQFERTLDASPRVTTLHLNSLGGRSAEATRIAELVRRRKLTTYVSESCMSACTQIFLAGQQRWIGERGALGFHQPGIPGMRPELLFMAIEEERLRMAALNMPPAFIYKALSTPHESIWRPSHQELLAARAITGVARPGQFAASGPTATQATLD